MNILAKLYTCRERAADYLAAYVYESGDEYHWLHSPAHDPATFPGHLLYGTWAGVMASALLRLDTGFDATKKERIASAINRFQRSDGTYVMTDIPQAVKKNHNEEYFSFHCTNYALGALRILGQPARHPLAFVEQLATKEHLDAWFAARNWKKPWTEGNNVVNLASFYAILAEDGSAWARERLVDMADWHDANQHPLTGFWHSDEGKKYIQVFNAMAGAAHNFHIYYYLMRDVPQPEKIIDSCLGLGYLGIRSACIDIDMVDILIHFRRYNYRLNEIDTILERYIIELLQVQNADGGFADDYVAPHVQYGHTTPARVSVTWTTWFRLATIGMLACTLFPEQRSQWRFRNTLGMGYANLDYPARDTQPAQRPLNGTLNGEWVPLPVQVRLAAMRNGRLLRQRATWTIRQKLK